MPISTIAVSGKTALEKRLDLEIQSFLVALCKNW